MEVLCSSGWTPALFLMEGLFSMLLSKPGSESSDMESFTRLHLCSSLRDNCSIADCLGFKVPSRSHIRWRGSCRFLFLGAEFISKPPKYFADKKRYPFWHLSRPIHRWNWMLPSRQAEPWLRIEHVFFSWTKASRNVKAEQRYTTEVDNSKVSRPRVARWCKACTIGRGWICSSPQLLQEQMRKGHAVQGWTSIE